MRTLIIVLCLMVLTACTDDNKAVELLMGEGYTQIHTTGYVGGGCSDDDSYHTGFTAVKGNHMITGVVCSSFGFKGATIRLFSATDAPVTPTTAAERESLTVDRKVDSILQAR